MSTNQSTAPAEPIKIQLARDEEGWNELMRVVDGHISQLLECSNERGVKAFMFIVDLLSNDDLDPDQQAVAAEHVLHAAFAYSTRSVREMNRYLNELNPGRVMRHRKVVAHA